MKFIATYLPTKKTLNPDGFACLAVKAVFPTEVIETALISGS